ncbi:hypothetical protein [Rhizobium phaseoli]|uniref:hypothetical protein n=1 Tax=Rhizobium phaseoli TaxID=396 RepID=UPI002556A609|nr:hypothetical protein [Rhizobium phaseoli]MDK4727438.1 hypothetical protein [Rhizobium phaseoli]
MSDQAKQEGGPWRPASKTEGLEFASKWCAHCLEASEAADWEDEFGNHVNGMCSLCDADWFGIQPEEWIIRNGMPWCKAFREDPTRPARCFFTKEMDV